MKKGETKFPFSMYASSGDGMLIAPRVHSDSMEILEVLFGSIRVKIGTETVEARAGDFIYIPPTLVLRVDALEEHTSIRGMIFDASILTANMDNFDNEILYMFYLQSKNKINIFNSFHPIYPVLAKYMQESYDEYISKDVCYKLPIRANIYIIMTSLLRFYCGSKNESDRIVYHNVLRLRPVIEHIADNFCKKIYVESLADMINVSPDYFTRMFKDSIGKTPIEYINGLRVNRALKLLFTTDLPMSEVAEATGFSNPNYFNKTFKQYMNTSPLAYRKASKAPISI